jgi:hypothetical protein
LKNPEGQQVIDHYISFAKSIKHFEKDQFAEWEKTNIETAMKFLKGFILKKTSDQS